MARKKQAASAGVDIFSASTGGSAGVSAQWWLMPAEQIHEGMVATARRIIRNQATQDQCDREWLTAYLGGVTGQSGATYGISRAATRRSKRCTYNITKSVIDSFTAEMVQSKPKPTFLTSDGDHELQQKAKAMEKWSDGMLHDLGYYDVRRQCWNDAGIWGDGIWKVWEEREQEETDEEEAVDAICLERIQTPMLVADDGECRDGKPRSVYERRWVDKRVAMAHWPEHAKAIFDCRRSDTDEGTPGFDSTADQILIWEAYHLPSRKGSGDGLHCICIEGATLFSESFEREPTPSGFPYVKLRRVDPPEGFRAVSGADELSTIQKNLNTWTSKRAKGLHLGAPHLVVEKGSLNIGKMSNDLLSIWELNKGTQLQPTSFMPQVVGAEMAAAIQEESDKAYQLFGITQLQAQGLKPAGLDSGEAQRVYNNTASQRFKVAQENDERAMLETVELLQACARRIIARGGRVVVKAAHGRAFEELDFEEIQLGESEHILQVFPTSALAREPAEKQQQVADLLKGGLVTPQEAKRLMGMPDTEEFRSYEDASYDLCMKMIDDICSHGRFMGPEMFMDLAESVKWFQLAYLKATRTNVPSERRTMLITWMKQATSIKGWPGYIPSEDEAAAQQAAQAAANAAPPMQQPVPGAPPANAPPPPEQMPPPPQGAPPGVPMQ